MRSYAGPSATTAAKTPVAARRGRRQRCVARGDGRPRSVTKRHVPARERSPPSEHTLASETRDGRATRAPAADIPPARLLLRRSHARGSDTLDARQQSESDATSPAAAAAAVANRFGLGDSPRPRSCKWLKKSSKILKKTALQPAQTMLRDISPVKNRHLPVSSRTARSPIAPKAVFFAQFVNSCSLRARIECLLPRSCAISSERATPRGCGAVR